MKTSYFAKSLALCLGIVLLLSISGVFAAWHYCGIPLETTNDDANFSLNAFTWAPEAILPTEKPGENYLVLLNSILNNYNIILFFHIIYLYKKTRIFYLIFHLLQFCLLFFLFLYKQVLYLQLKVLFLYQNQTLTNN